MVDHGWKSQLRTQASSRYPSYQRRLGTERDSEFFWGEFSRQAWQVTSHRKSLRTTGYEAVEIYLSKVLSPGHKSIWFNS